MAEKSPVGGRPDHANQQAPIESGEGNEEEEEDRLKRECERLFHPEKFELHAFATSVPTIEAPNLDSGVIYYNKALTNEPVSWSPHHGAEPSSDSELATKGTKTVRMCENGEELFSINRKPGRSMSQQYDPKCDMPTMRKVNTASGSLKSWCLAGTNDENCPQFQDYASRHRPYHSVIDRSRKSKSKKDVVGPLPTIHDEDIVAAFKPDSRSSLEREFICTTPDEGLSMNKRQRTISEMSKITSFEVDSPEKTISDQDADVEEHGDDTETFALDSNEYFEGEKKKKTRKRKKYTKRRGSVNLIEDDVISQRSARGTEMNYVTNIMDLDEEAMMLQNKDLEAISHHRFDPLSVSPRHTKVKRQSSVNSGTLTVQRTGKSSKEHQRSMMDSMYSEEKQQVDRSPHSLFIEMDELIGDEWVEMSRWIKYEEAREPGAERWGKPHVSSLSFHSLLNLRIHLEKGAILLDHVGKDLTNVLSSIVEEMLEIGYINEETSYELLRVLLHKHKYVDSKVFKWRGSLRKQSYISVSDSVNDDIEPNLKSRISRQFSRGDSEFVHQIKHLLEDEKHNYSRKASKTPSVVEHTEPNGNIDHKIIDMPEFSGSNASLQRSPSFAGDPKKLSALAKKSQSIMMRLPEDTEGALTLVGNLDIIKEPLTAFVRLAEGTVMPDGLEIPIPVRFIFLLLTPTSSTNIDCHEVGRSFSTLMSNMPFQNACYRAEDRKDLLSAINNFLDESVVLPPGDWDSKNLLSMSEIDELRRKRKDKMNKNSNTATEKAMDADNGLTESYKTNPLMKAPFFFGGMINDIRRRSKFYLSDFKDGLCSQCFAAAIFIYFAGLSGAVAFGGLLGEKTENLIGISETIVLSSITGIIFALFSGMPLIITGSTGPLLLFDESLFKLCSENGVDYLAIRIWIGVWLIVVALVVAMFQGSLLVKFFTKFTKEIFSSLVSLIFIFEAMKKLVQVYKDHPLAPLSFYCTQSAYNANSTIPELAEVVKTEPNTALLSTILMFGTFFVAYFLRAVKGSTFLGRTARKILGDFGVPISIAIMVAGDFFIEETFTEKLKVPDGLEVTSPNLRGWIINPLGEIQPLEAWMAVASILPAILLYLVLFIETHICELIMIEKSGNLKGAGLHWDIVLLSVINLVAGLLGGPFICAATVRANAHASALTVMSTTHAPGEMPKVVEVKDQRLSCLLVSVLIGLSIFLSPLLKHIPYAVLFGVFLYMGISSMNGIQLFDRLILFLVPVKHHPRFNYVRRVKTWKMHLFTILEFCGLMLLWTVKSSPIALALPFFVVGMVPYRMSLNLIFDQLELEALDGKHAGQFVQDDENEPAYRSKIGA